MRNRAHLPYGGDPSMSGGLPALFTGAGDTHRRLRFALLILRRALQM
jgi:hypothetical protein